MPVAIKEPAQTPSKRHVSGIDRQHKQDNSQGDELDNTIRAWCTRSLSQITGQALAQAVENEAAAERLRAVDTSQLDNDTAEGFKSAKMLMEQNARLIIALVGLTESNGSDEEPALIEKIHGLSKQLQVLEGEKRNWMKRAEKLAEEHETILDLGEQRWAVLKRDPRQHMP